jgi:hypothetical protein
MKLRHEYLHGSMYGSYWEDCIILNYVREFSNQRHKVWILFFDPVIEEYDIRLVEHSSVRRKPRTMRDAPGILGAGWKEAAIAWEVCASIHKAYCKKRDPFYTTRQGDFTRHAAAARKLAGVK